MATFKIDGQETVVATAKEVQKLLKAAGIQASIKDILGGKVEGVTVVEEADVAPVVAEDVAEDAVEPDATDEFMADESDADVAARKVAEEQQAEANAIAAQVGGKPATPATPTDVEYPEIGTLKTEKDFKKAVKKLSDANVFEWCELEGATWKRCPDQAPIDRMRAVMAIKAKHFPSTAPKGETKSKSKYSDYTDEQLVQMALDNDITVRDDKGDKRIMRMYTIMALKQAGLLG